MRHAGLECLASRPSVDAWLQPLTFAEVSRALGLGGTPPLGIPRKLRLVPAPGTSLSLIEPIESEPPRCSEPHGFGIVEGIDIDDFVLESQAQALHEREADADAVDRIFAAIRKARIVLDI